MVSKLSLLPESPRSSRKRLGKLECAGDYLLDALCASLVGGGINAEGVCKFQAQGDARGNQGSSLNETLKEFANSSGHLMSIRNPFRVGHQSMCRYPKVARWRAQPWAMNLVNAFGVFCSHHYECLELVELDNHQCAGDYERLQPCSKNSAMVLTT